LEPYFFVPGPEQRENTGVLLAVLYGCKELRKGSGSWNLKLLSDINI